jgi:hypothetical protein
MKQRYENNATNFVFQIMKRSQFIKTYRLSSRLAAIATLLVIFALTFATTFPAQAQKEDDNPPSAPGNGGAALGTGLISLLPGQSVRLAAVNVGGKSVPVELLVADAQGNVLILCNEFVAPGKAFFDKFTHPGGANRLDLYAQVRVRQNVKDIEDLVPSLQIVDDETGRTEHILSGADFAGIRPIWVPS